MKDLDKAAFNIQFRGGGGATMEFYGYDRKDGDSYGPCFWIKLTTNNHYMNSRIWVSSENSQERDLDTEHNFSTQTQLCMTKWINIHFDHSGLME